MSQVTEYTISGDPLLMAQLATELEALFAAATSCNRGAVAPANPYQGMLWWDTSADPTEVLRRYTVAAGWIALASVNITTGAVVAAGGTVAATADRLVLRDASGRAQIATPSAAADIARKDTVDTHAALTNPHSATATPTASRIAMYNSELRLKSGAAPSAVTDVVRLGDFPGNVLHFLSNGVSAKPASDNWNNYTDTGIYQASGLTNAPVTGSIYVSVIRHSTSAWCIQTARNFLNTEMWQRALENSVWGDWELIWSTAITLTAGGDFSGTDNIVLSRTGELVTMRWKSLTHSSSSNPTSAAGIIPAAYRPIAETSNIASKIYYADQNGLRTIGIEYSGAFSFSFPNYAGTMGSRTNTGAGYAQWSVA